MFIRSVYLANIWVP